VADHITLTVHEKVMHLITVLQGQAYYIIHSDLAIVAYDDVVGALKAYRDHHQVAAYWFQLRARSWLRIEFLQEYAVASSHYQIT
jgi:hypothetical protein